MGIKRISSKTKKYLITFGVIYASVIAIAFIFLGIASKTNPENIIFDSRGTLFNFLGFVFYITGFSFPLYIVTSKGLRCSGWLIFLGCVLSITLGASFFLFHPQSSSAASDRVLCYILAGVIESGIIFAYLKKLSMNLNDSSAFWCLFGWIFVAFVLIANSKDPSYKYSSDDDYEEDVIETYDKTQEESKEEMEHIYYHTKTEVEVVSNGPTGYKDKFCRDEIRYTVYATFIFKNALGQERKKETSYWIESYDGGYVSTSDVESRYSYVLRPSDDRWSGDWMF